VSGRVPQRRTPADARPGTGTRDRSTLSDADVAAFVARAITNAPPLSPRQIQLLYDTLPPAGS
jgi:hypothetical protein